MFKTFESHNKRSIKCSTTIHQQHISTLKQSNTALIRKIQPETNNKPLTTTTINNKKPPQYQSIRTRSYRSRKVQSTAHYTSTGEVNQTPSIEQNQPKQKTKSQQVPPAKQQHQHSSNKNNNTQKKSQTQHTIDPMSTTDPTTIQQQQPQSSRQAWSLPNDILTARTALFMHEKIAELRKQKHDQKVQKDLFDAMTPSEQYAHQGKYSNSSFSCDNCLLTNHHCVCCELPDRTDLTNNLNTFVDVVVYAHSGEVATLGASNTAHFLPRHGAYPVLMGDVRGESILRNLILSRPRDSVMVLFPSATSITPDDFMKRYIASKTTTHPFIDSYPPIPEELRQSIVKKNEEIDIIFKKHQDEQIASFTTPVTTTTNNETTTTTTITTRPKKVNLAKDPRTNEILQLQQDRIYTESLIHDLIDDTIAEVFPGFCSSREFYNNMMQHYAKTHSNNENNNENTTTHKPLVIVLDGTWSNAKTLDRRLTLLMSEIFQKNTYNEREKLLVDSTITPANYLHRVRVTRALRSDVGQLRRLQSSERVTVAGAGLGFKSVAAMLHPNAKSSKSITNTTNSTTTTSDPVLSSLESKQDTTTTTNNTSNITMVEDDDILPNSNENNENNDNTNTKFSLPPDQNNSKRGSVILEDDATIEDNSGGRVSTLHAFLVLLEELYDLPIITSHRNLSVEKEEMKKTIDSAEKRDVLDVVSGFTDILQAMVIGYHTQKGLSKAQLLDPETRQIVKKKYQDFLEQKELARQTKISNNISKKSTKTTDENVSSSDGEEHQGKKQRVNGEGDEQMVSIVEKDEKQ